MYTRIHKRRTYNSTWELPRRSETKLWYDVLEAPNIFLFESNFIQGREGKTRRGYANGLARFEGSSDVAAENILLRAWLENGSTLDGGQSRETTALVVPSTASSYSRAAF